MSRAEEGFRYLARPFALRDYRLYVAGNVATNIAVWLQRMGVGWLTWELTQSAAWLGLMALAEALPALAFTLFAGAIIDRVNFFRLLKAAQWLIFVYALTLAVLTMSGNITIWILALLTISRGFFGAFYRPARMSLVYAIVGKDMLPAALSFNSMIFNASRFIGPATGGLIIFLYGIEWVFVLAAALYLTYSIILVALRVKVKPKKETRKRGILADIVDGVRYVLDSNGLRTQMAIILTAGLLARPLTDLFPGFVGAVFDMGASGLAWLLTAHGIGAVLGSLYLATRPQGISGMTSISMLCLFFIGISLLCFSLSPSFEMAVVFVFVVGFFMIIQNITNQTLIQYNLDQEYRGRVLSIYSITQQGIPALGALTMGLIAEFTNLRIPVLFGAIILIGVFLLVWPQRNALAQKMEQ